MQFYGGNTMFNRDAEKETVNILLRENKKLKRDNQRLRESLGELERYKKEYRDLIDGLKKTKECYLSKLEDFNEMEAEYKKELEKAIKNRTNNI